MLRRCERREGNRCSTIDRDDMTESSPTKVAERGLGRPRAMTEAERRHQIVAAARCIFSEKGYWAATMDDVSRQAGMSKKTVYQLFSSKAEIFDLLLRDFKHPFRIPFDVDGRTQREALTEGLLPLVTFALDEAHIAITRVLIAEAAQPGDVADAIKRQGIGRGDWALQQWLASQTKLGRYTVSDPEEMAATIFYAAAGDAPAAAHPPPPGQRRHRRPNRTRGRHVFRRTGLDPYRSDCRQNDTGLGVHPGTC